MKFLLTLNHPTLDNLLRIDDIDSSVEQISNILANAASRMIKRERRHNYSIQGPEQPPWWDSDCEKLKSEKFSALDIYRLNNLNVDLVEYKNARKSLKSLCSIKKLKHADRNHDDYVGACKDTNGLRKQVKCFLRKSYTAEIVSAAEWFNYFLDLYNTCDVNLDGKFEMEIQDSLNCSNPLYLSENQNHILDSPITSNEILSTIKSLPTSKALGPDVIVNEIYKHSLVKMLPNVITLFNM
ncbi:hypothetical protein SNE40_021249 [Patella caerulea]|uniref:Uncharacterized protein n=1 Tax=Patella caerulea TaxID=87958 RepID=A0AAN8GGL3_PATCE